MLVTVKALKAIEELGRQLSCKVLVVLKDLSMDSQSIVRYLYTV